MENKMLELLKTRRSVRSYKPEQIAAQELDAVLEAGTYAPTGMGMQSPVIVAVQDAQTRQAVMELNQQARGGSGDPYYGAPTIVLVLADPERGTCVPQGVSPAGNGKKRVVPQKGTALFVFPGWGRRSCNLPGGKL